MRQTAPEEVFPGLVFVSMGRPALARSGTIIVELYS